ncbi:MAG TPA: NfeD family protein [Thermoanaerobaculia bacterium]|nr:NfeD family protein [Thermoanaerobaculia bacterium]
MLTMTFLLFALLGCLYVMVAAFLGHADFGGGGHAHAPEGGHGTESGHAAPSRYGIDGTGRGSVSESAAGGGAAAFHFPFFSPLALATLMAAIGGWGLIAKYGLRAGDRTSLLFAIPAAVLTAYGVTFLGWKIVSASRASSVIHLADLVGAAAEVTTPIPAGGLGEAVALVSGQRYSAPAREAEGREIPRGVAVTVVAMAGSTLVVSAGERSSQP